MFFFKTDSGCLVFYDSTRFLQQQNTIHVFSAQTATSKQNPVKVFLCARSIEALELA
jgi:hypothetical protein